MSDERFGRFLGRRNGELFRQFVLNDLGILRYEEGLPASRTGTYFFQKYGIRNSGAQLHSNQPATSYALQKQGEKKRQKKQLLDTDAGAVPKFTAEYQRQSK